MGEMGIKGEVVMRFCVLKMISVAFCIFVSSVYATEATRLSIANNTNLLKSISRILVEKNSRTVAQRKISSHLLKTKEDLKVGVKQFQNKTNSVPSFVVNSLGVTYCKVVIRAEVTDSLVKKLQSHGAVDIKTHPRWKTISCRIPADEMEKIAEDSSVYSIREQTRPILNKANTSEGVSAHQIDKAVSKFGVTGKGVKIGVISDSVRYLENVQASGDLPHVTVLPGQDGAFYNEDTDERLDTGEGTAMLEIVHDVAPEAELYFATASPTDAQFADNIIALQKEGCHIIVDDVGYFNEPAFQDGIIAQAVNEVRSKGCLYFSAAGNSGNKKLSKSGTYEGDFVPFGTQIINGEEYEYHSFDGKEATKFYCGRSAVTLQWADQWGGSENDYALLLFTADGNVIGFSDDVQNGSEGSCPYEIVRCCVDESCAHNSFGYLYVLKKKNAARRYFRIDTLRGSLEVSTSGSTYGHSAAESAVCVGAASALNGVFSSASTMEDYSSDGPRRIFYNPDGSAITPGNFLSTGGKLLKKVDITAGDRVSCATPGFNPFPGTSAAAPHAAAIAALMLSARRDLTQEQIVEIMGATSWRLNGHDTSVDELSGRGIINALEAMEATRPYLNITESEVNAPAEGGLSSVRIESNGSFNLSADKDWISIQNASGNGTKDVQFNVLRNSSASGRKGTIKISNDYGNECILSVSQAGMTAPARPVVTASDGTSSDSVRITWENSARALSYSIKRAESTTGNKTLLDSNAVSPYVDNDVVPGKTYYYWVTAVNEVGENESVSDSGYRSISLNFDATGNLYTKDGGESSFSVSGNSPWTSLY